MSNINFTLFVETCIALPVMLYIFQFMKLNSKRDEMLRNSKTKSDRKAVLDTLDLKRLTIALLILLALLGKIIVDVRSLTRSDGGHGLSEALFLFGFVSVIFIVVLFVTSKTPAGKFIAEQRIDKKR